MAEYSKELEWKNHAPFFTNLNQHLNNLKIIFSNKDLNNLRKYYNELNDIRVHYSAYVSTDDIKTNLEECNKVLYSIEYASPKWSQEYNKKIMESRDKLVETHELIVQELFNSGLLPRFTISDTKTPAAAKQKS